MIPENIKKFLLMEIRIKLWVIAVSCGLMLMLLCGSGAWYLLTSSGIKSAILDLAEMSSRAGTGISLNVPLYGDSGEFRSEHKLRKYLLNEHLASAVKHGVSPLKSEEDIPALASVGRLIKLDPGADDLYYFYNVKKEYRYLAPRAHEALVAVASGIQQSLKARYPDAPTVKIAVSSALRPLDYQAELRKSNVNAAIVSTHSTGAGFDIFHDDFYVMLPAAGSSAGSMNSALDVLRRETGFLLGDSLRGQLRTVLAGTLMQLQDRGLIYVTLEKKQNCYHVTPAL